MDFSSSPDKSAEREASKFTKERFASGEGPYVATTPRSPVISISLLALWYLLRSVVFQEFLKTFQHKKSAPSTSPFITLTASSISASGVTEFLGRASSQSLKSA